MRIADKVAVVTGGGAGIGKGIALRLAVEGADIVIVDIDETVARATARKIETLGRRSLVVKADIGRKNEVEKMVVQVSEFGRIDILVNNAGVENISPLLEISEAEWDRILTVNLKGAFLCSQAVAGAMIADQQGGKIINMGSIAGLTPPKGEPHYAASKGGVHLLTKQLAVELAPYKINVNAVAPGIIRNGLSTHQSLADPEQAKQIEQAIPWGRAGSPQDIANAVLFLASEEADYITGVVLPVDGGILLKLM
jgi:NAD(P)-dependent dehydrogenase (short-subunit alcohol dehydrogenase family)